MQVSINLAGLRLSTDLENTVFRIVQEATTNVMKHAASERVEVNIARTGRWLELVVRDWGLGPDAASQVGQGKRIGLTSIADRAALLGGSLRIESKPQQGTTLRVRLPVAAAPISRSA
ncbi:MAG: hypothetical protein EXR52_07440 [Dehalococcoidia bacterium]|nr:hypothetical protein [Dehalococcoidia bacterium]